MIKINLSLLGHTDCVLDAKFSPDSLLVVSGASDCSIRLWNSETGKLI